jgi:hypothetical protein
MNSISTNISSKEIQIGKKIYVWPINLDDLREVFNEINGPNDFSSKVFSIDNLSFKDTTSYFSIIADKKPGQWIARLCLGTKKKSILLPDGSRNGCRYYLNSIEDLYKYD